LGIGRDGPATGYASSKIGGVLTFPPKSGQSLAMPPLGQVEDSCLVYQEMIGHLYIEDRTAPGHVSSKTSGRVLTTLPGSDWLLEEDRPAAGRASSRTGGRVLTVSDRVADVVMSSM
jgi:hypothetical protein